MAYKTLPSIQALIATLKSLREAKDYSQRVLAHELGIPQSHLSKIEAGQVNIRLASFIEMARTLGMEVMLVPRQEVSLVKSLVHSQEKMRHGDEVKPAYTPDDEGDEDNKDV